MPLKLAARIRARSTGYLEAAPETKGVRRSRLRRARAARVEPPTVVVNCSDGGHSGASDWQGRADEFSRQIAFLYKALSLPYK